MGNCFTKGYKIQLVNGGFATVESKLGEGGQGVVYKVDYNGKKYALKWYHPSVLKNPDAFYQNLSVNIGKCAPTSSFLWPLFLTQKTNGSFGYLMDLRPQKYVDFSDFLLAKVHFSSLGAVVNAAINITKGFMVLHRLGYSYQDLNDGNFFIDPKNGEVLICDNDNVVSDKINLGIKGKARYMAPEVVRNISQPNYESDRFSLSVILFRLLFMDHPLEGTIVASAPCITEALELKYYGQHPVFIFDKNDNSNRPVPSIHRNVIKLWNIYPQFIRDMFIRAFSCDAMNADRMDVAKKSRILNPDWLKAFYRLRSSIVRCCCGEETFLEIGKESKCIHCGRSIPKTPVIKWDNSGVVIPVFPGIKVYESQVDGMSPDSDEVVAEITRHPTKPGVWGITNDSSSPLQLKSVDGSESYLDSGKTAPIVKIAEISFSPKGKAAKIER